MSHLRSATLVIGRGHIWETHRREALWEVLCVFRSLVIKLEIVSHKVIFLNNSSGVSQKPPTAGYIVGFLWKTCASGRKSRMKLEVYPFFNITGILSQWRTCLPSRPEHSHFRLCPPKNTILSSLKSLYTKQELHVGSSSCSHLLPSEVAFPYQESRKDCNSMVNLLWPVPADLVSIWCQCSSL